MEIQIVVNTLKRALKSKGINYAQLAEVLGITERSVIRTLSEGSISVERLLSICDLMGVSLIDFVKMIEVDIEKRDDEFTQEQEEFFAGNWNFLTFYILLFDYDSPKQLAREYRIDKNTLEKMLAKLDELKIIEWLPGNEAKILGPRKFARDMGPIDKASEPIIKQFMENNFKNLSGRSFYRIVNLSKRAQKKFQENMDKMAKEIGKEMEIERMLKVPFEPVGFYLGIGPMDFPYENLKDFKL